MDRQWTAVIGLGDEEQSSHRNGELRSMMREVGSWADP